MIEEVTSYFSSVLTSEGTPWEIYRVNTPSNQPYTNSLILNNKVFVPIMNSAWDGPALEVYEAALPNYIIEPFTGSWQATDALHCRVKGIPDLSYLQFILGDVNMDDSIDVLDVVFTVNHVLGMNTLSPNQIQLADMNNDGIVNILDVIQIVNLIIG